MSKPTVAFDVPSNLKKSPLSKPSTSAFSPVKSMNGNGKDKTSFMAVVVGLRDANSSLDMWTKAIKAKTPPPNLETLLLPTVIPTALVLTAADDILQPLSIYQANLSFLAYPPTDPEGRGERCSLAQLATFALQRVVNLKQQLRIDEKKILISVLLSKSYPERYRSILSLTGLPLPIGTVLMKRKNTEHEEWEWKRDVAAQKGSSFSAKEPSQKEGVFEYVNIIDRDLKDMQERFEWEVVDECILAETLKLKVIDASLCPSGYDIGVFANLQPPFSSHSGNGSSSNNDTSSEGTDDGSEGEETEGSEGGDDDDNAESESEGGQESDDAN